MFSKPSLFYTINQNVIRENDFLRFLNCKVPTVTPIEMKQEQVRSNPKGELRGRDEGRLIDPTRRTGELDCMFGPTHLFGELDGLLHPTRLFGELDGVLGPTRPYDELD